MFTGGLEQYQIVCANNVTFGGGPLDMWYHSSSRGVRDRVVTWVNRMSEWPTPSKNSGQQSLGEFPWLVIFGVHCYILLLGEIYHVCIIC